MPQVDTNSPNLSPNSKSQPNGNHINGHNSSSNLPSPSEILKRLRASGAVDRIRKAIDSRLNDSEHTRTDHVKELTKNFLDTSSANLDEPRLLFTAVQQQVLPSVQQLIAKEVSRLTEDGHANWFRDMFLNEFDKAFTDNMKESTTKFNADINSRSPNKHRTKDKNIQENEEKGYEQQLMDRLNRNLFQDKKGSAADKVKTNVLETQGNKVSKEKKIVSASKPPKNKMDKKGRPTNLKQTDSAHSSRRSKESSPSHSKDNEPSIEKERSPQTNLIVENVSKEPLKSPHSTEKKINDTEDGKEPNVNLIEKAKDTKEPLTDKQPHSSKDNQKTHTPLNHNEEKSPKPEEIEDLQEEIFENTPTFPEKVQDATNDTEDTIGSPKEQQKVDEGTTDVSKKLDELALDSDIKNDNGSSICMDKPVAVVFPEKQNEEDGLAVNSSQMEIEEEPPIADEAKDLTPEPDAVENPDEKTGEIETIVQEEKLPEEKTIEKESKKSTTEVPVEENVVTAEPVIEKEEKPDKIESNENNTTTSIAEPVVLAAPESKSDLPEDVTHNATETSSSNIEQIKQASTSDKQSPEQLQHIENPVNVTSEEANQEPDHKVNEIDIDMKPSKVKEQMIKENESNKVNEVDTEINISEEKEQMIKRNESNKVNEIDTEINPSKEKEQMIKENESNKVNEIDTEINPSKEKEQMIKENESNKVNEIDTEINPSKEKEQMIKRNESNKVNEIDTDINPSEEKEQMMKENQSNGLTDMALNNQKLEKALAIFDDKLTEKPSEIQEAEKSDMKNKTLEEPQSEIKDEKPKGKRRGRPPKKKRKRLLEMTKNENHLEKHNSREEGEIQPRRKRKIRPSQRLRDGTEHADMSIIAKIGSSRAEYATDERVERHEDVNSSTPKKLKESKSRSRKHSSMENGEPLDEIKPRKRGRKPKRKRGRPSNAEINARNNKNNNEVASGAEDDSKTEKKSIEHQNISASHVDVYLNYRWGKKRCVPQDLELQRKIVSILERLLEKDYADPFADPVDPLDEGCHDYYEEIKNPMDINTILQRLQSSTEIEGYYETINDVLQDINQIWENCTTFNSLHDPICKDASKCKVDLEVWLEEINISSGKGMRTKRRESFKLKESMKNEKKVKHEKAIAGGSKRKSAEQQQERREIDPNDGRLVGKSGGVYDQYDALFKSWYFFTVESYNQETGSYRLVWDCDRPTTEEARFGTGELFPIYKIS